MRGIDARIDADFHIIGYRSRATNSRAGWRDRQGPRSESLLFLLFVAPNMILFGIFTFWPLIYSGYLSLVRWDMLSPTKTWVGLDNYRTSLPTIPSDGAARTRSSSRRARSADRWSSGC